MNSQENDFEKIYGNFDSETKRFEVEKIIENGNYNEIIINALINGIFDEDPGVMDSCSRALESIPKSLVSYTSEQLSSLIKSDNIQIRNTASNLLIKYGIEASPSLEYLLRDSDNDAKKFAIDILGVIAGKDYIEKMLRLIDDPDDNIVVSAIEAIGNIFEREIDNPTPMELAVDTLLEKYHASEEMRAPIIEALSKIGGDQVENFLIKTLDTEEDQFLQIAIMDSLAECSHSASLCDRLLSNLLQYMPYMQLVALKTIMAISQRIEYEIVVDGDLRSVAQNGLFDSDINVKAASVLALGAKYQDMDVPGLVHALNSSNTDLQNFIISNMLFNSSKEVLEIFYKEFLLNFGDKNAYYEGEALNLININLVQVDFEEQYKNFSIILDLLVCTDKEDYCLTCWEMLDKSKEFNEIPLEEIINKKHRVLLEKGENVKSQRLLKLKSNLYPN